MGVWEQMLVMLILEEGFHEDWRGGSGGGGGGGGAVELGGQVYRYGEIGEF